MKTEKLKEVFAIEIIETENKGENGIVITREVIERKRGTTKVTESFKMRYLENDNQDNK